MEVDSQTPLRWAVLTEAREAMVKLLLDKGADIEAKDNGGQTPLSQAAEWWREGCDKFVTR